VLGAGPFQKGSIYDATRFAGRDLNEVGHGNVLRSGLIRANSSHDSRQDKINYDSPHLFALPKSKPAETDVIKTPDVQQAGFED
jgi:hypothetical protein